MTNIAVIVQNLVSALTNHIKLQ